MKVLVTGASGFIGHALVPRLIKAGHEVVTSSRHANSGPIGTTVHPIADLGPDTDWSEALFEVEAVIHLAARVHIMTDKAQDPLADNRRINTEGTRKLAKDAATAGVRHFIFMSTIKVNGESSGLKPFCAHDLPAPKDPYAIAKLEAEEALKELSNRTKMEIVIIRSPLIYGEGVKGNFLRLLELSNKGIPLPLLNIKNTRSLVGIDNLIDLISCCIDHPKAASQTFLVSDNENISTTELIKKIKIAMGKSLRLFPIPLILFKPLGHLIGKSSEVNRLFSSLTINISHTCNQLNWKPKFSLDYGLKKTVNWYLKNL